MSLVPRSSRTSYHAASRTRGHTRVLRLGSLANGACTVVRVSPRCLGSRTTPTDGCPGSLPPPARTIGAGPLPGSRRPSTCVPSCGALLLRAGTFGRETRSVAETISRPDASPPTARKPNVAPRTAAARASTGTRRGHAGRLGRSRPGGEAGSRCRRASVHSSRPQPGEGTVCPHSASTGSTRTSSGLTMSRAAASTPQFSAGDSDDLTAPGERICSGRLLPWRVPGRARWGVSGSLNPKSAPCGAERRPRDGSSGLGLRTWC